MASVKKQHQHAECLNSWGVSFGLTTLRLLTLVSEGYLLKGSTEHNFLNSVVWIRNTFYSGDQEIHFLLLRAKGVKERERAASQTPLYSLVSWPHTSLPWLPCRGGMNPSLKFAQMSRLVILHMHQKGIKSFISYIMRLSGESRASSQASLKMA